MPQNNIHKRTLQYTSTPTSDVCFLLSLRKRYYTAFFNSSPQVSSFTFTVFLNKPWLQPLVSITHFMLPDFQGNYIASEPNCGLTEVPWRSLELCLPVVWRLWWEQPPSLSRGPRDTAGSLPLNSPREKLKADIPSSSLSNAQCASVMSLSYNYLTSK